MNNRCLINSDQAILMMSHLSRSRDGWDAELKMGVKSSRMFRYFQIYKGGGGGRQLTGYQDTVIKKFG